ncbi:MAG TPA: carbohydrate ABC transporter permease [Verrucomicrobiales bacterium]|nr:carbohydrate ABC transporter permease [Verrucomicrobiales bacterium]
MAPQGSSPGPALRHPRSFLGLLVTGFLLVALPLFILQVIASSAFALLLVMFPFLWLLQMSVRPNADILGYQLRFTPTLDHYRALWSGGFGKSFLNSLVTSTLSTALALVIGTPAAYALSRWRFRARHQIALWILATRMAPPIAFTIPFFLAYSRLGLLDTVFGLVLIYLTFNLALVIWMMQTYFDGVPRALEEAAWIDGASLWQTFTTIVLPMSGPGLAATAILCFILSWNDFFFALILTRTEAITAPVAVVNFMNYEGWEWGKIAAGGTMVMLPVLVFSIAVRKFLVSGLTAGAVKG